MKLFKFIGGIFKIVDRFQDEKRKYLKAGPFWKGFALLVYAFFVVLAAFLCKATYWFFAEIRSADTLGEILHSIGCIFGGIFVGYITLMVAFYVISTLIQDSIIAFSAARNPKLLIESLGDKLGEKLKENDVKFSIEENTEVVEEQKEETKKEPKRNHKSSRGNNGIAVCPG